MKVHIEIPRIRISPNKLEKILPNKDHIKKLMEMSALNEKSKRRLIGTVIENDQLKGYNVDEWGDDGKYTKGKYFSIEELDKINLSS